MPRCEHYDVCGLEVGGKPERYDQGGTPIFLCILHSHDPLKNSDAFRQILAKHRENANRQCNVAFIVFPEQASFIGSTFTDKADFANATFMKGALFWNTTFMQGADFYHTTFKEEGDFGGATFTGKATFRRARFLGRTVFAPDDRQTEEVRVIFRDVDVDFRHVTIGPAATLSFTEADLGRTQFLGTDLRRVQFTGVTWALVGRNRRHGVCDEIVPLDRGEGRLWFQIEELYRQLKQNYEDKRDYRRAGEFHYGEKEMLRKNPETPWNLHFFLTLYWLISGYGERMLRPFVWTVALFFASTVGYQFCDLSFRSEYGAGGKIPTWAAVAAYGLRTTLFLRPQDFVLSVGANLINIVQSILGPLLLGLFGLAVRQKLKR